MASITDLRQKRAALWEKTKKFLDNAKREMTVTVFKFSYSLYCTVT